ncbi:nickel transporter, partial [Klebsiella pneumoniae]|nr:nickel transporter [Klebsiella pneumoniae]
QTYTAKTPHHDHTQHCVIGHQHLPDPDQQLPGDDWRARAAIVLSTGKRPCSGAIMGLRVSKVIGVFGWVMAAALAMGAGTS